VGLIGPNGCGKTTLLRLFLGDLTADAGTIRRGSKLQVAYFDQFRTQLDDDATLANVISPGSEFVDVAGTRKHVISYLGDFLFPPQRARAKVASLSGGERNRLLLARLFVQPANVLVLDEPTNDLDIETLELLEALLQDYSGTLFLVSHDRAFLDNIVTQSIVFEGDSVLREYAGGYEDWQRALRFREAQVPEPSEPRARKRAASGRRSSPPAPSNRLSQKEARELEALPSRIAALEQEQAAISQRLADPALYRDEPQEVSALQARYDEIDGELTQLLERWEALESRQDISPREQ
jgi:ATP-binding cassette subfamily F protein uup